MEYYDAMQKGFKVIGFVSEFATLLENADKVFTNPDVKGIEKVSLGFRVVTVGLSALDILAKQYGCSLTAQMNIKKSELIIRIIDVSVKLSENQAINPNNSFAVENIILPFLSSHRCLNEFVSLKWENLANGTEEEGRVPIEVEEPRPLEAAFDEDYVPTFKTVGHIQLTREDCIQKSHQCDYEAVVLRIGEVAARTNIASKSLESYKKLRGRGVRVANPMPNVREP